MIGKTLGHYQITNQIGKGGMGEVFQAKDQILGRDVAIKVLPEEFARDADRVARFQREAKVLASLNHANIAAIHGLEQSEGKNFLVLELVEGETRLTQLGSLELFRPIEHRTIEMMTEYEKAHPETPKAPFSKGACHAFHTRLGNRVTRLRFHICGASTRLLG